MAKNDGNQERSGRQREKGNGRRRVRRVREKEGRGKGRREGKGGEMEGEEDKLRWPSTQWGKASDDGGTAKVKVITHIYV